MIQYDAHIQKFFRTMWEDYMSHKYEMYSFYQW